MEITFSTEPLTETDDRDLVEKINGCLGRLRLKRVLQIERATFPRSKLAWKLAVYREVVLYRIVALTESIALNWNHNNFLGAYLSGRALIETSAFLLEFEQQLDKQVAANDVPQIDRILTKHTFATRDKGWIQENPETEATNILTYIDRLEKRLVKGIRGHYDRMSERCHPNYLGHHHMFSSLNTKNGLTTFSDEKDLAAHRGSIIAAMVPLLLVENCIGRLEMAGRRITQIQGG